MTDDDTDTTREKHGIAGGTDAAEAIRETVDDSDGGGDADD